MNRDYLHSPSIRETSEVAKNHGKMNLVRVEDFLNATPVSALRRAWGARIGYLDPRSIDASQLTVEEAGELAAIYGLKLPDILAV